MTAAYAIFAGIVGMILGSFFNVVAYRLPRKESLSTPGSHCPHCDTPIKPYDNVPVFGWLWLRGRCRACGKPISPRYPIVELVTGLLMAAVVVAKGANSDAWLGLVLVAILVPVTLIDLDHQIIPNVIVGPGAVAGLALVLATRSGHTVEHLIAGAAAGGFLLAAVLAYPRGMGLGDVKLAGMMGIYLGRAVAPAMLMAMLAGTLIGAGIMARKGVAEGRKTKVPFGPFLAFGAVVALFAGDAMVDWYSDHYL